MSEMAKNMRGNLSQEHRPKANKNQLEEPKIVPSEHRPITVTKEMIEAGIQAQNIYRNEANEREVRMILEAAFSASEDTTHA